MSAGREVKKSEDDAPQHATRLQSELEGEAKSTKETEEAVTGPRGSFSREGWAWLPRSQSEHFENE